MESTFKITVLLRKTNFPLWVINAHCRDFNTIFFCRFLPRQDHLSSSAPQFKNAVAAKQGIAAMACVQLPLAVFG